jgi:hypothetical protein
MRERLRLRSLLRVVGGRRWRAGVWGVVEVVGWVGGR